MHDQFPASSPINFGDFPMFYDKYVSDIIIKNVSDHNIALGINKLNYQVHLSGHV